MLALPAAGTRGPASPPARPPVPLPPPRSLALPLRTIFRAGIGRPAAGTHGHVPPRRVSRLLTQLRGSIQRRGGELPTPQHRCGESEGVAHARRGVQLRNGCLAAEDLRHAGVVPEHAAVAAAALALRPERAGQHTRRWLAGGGITGRSPHRGGGGGGGR
jgi:hypothetical protein